MSGVGSRPLGREGDYGPGAKLDWHVHPCGQVLLIIEGTGYYQDYGKPIRIVHKGDAIKCAFAKRNLHS
jgi:quercetin dioxygenase-like cupin family protein